MDRPTDGLTDRWVDRQMERQVGKQTDDGPRVDAQLTDLSTALSVEGVELGRLAGGETELEGRE